MDMIDLLSEDPAVLGFDPVELKARYDFERDRRIHPKGNDQYVEIDRELGHMDDDPYMPRIERDPVNDEVEVLIIGAGFGGMLAGANLRKRGINDIRVVDRAGDFGGTWYWNRYPGAACDTEAYIYLPMLEEIGYVPTHKYAFAPEILEHSKAIARHFDLYRNALLHTDVENIVWEEGSRRWIVSTDRGDTVRARFIVMSNGPLNRPKLPGIPGIGDFAGHMFHTSRWDYAYTGGDSTGNLTGLADKRVGIIGTGATSVQCIPKLGASAKELYVFQRTPSSVDVRANRPTDPTWAASLSPGWQRERIENFTSITDGYDADTDLVKDGWTDIFTRLTGVAARAASERLGRRLTAEERDRLTRNADYVKMSEVRARVDDVVSDPVTAEALKPWYRQLCKRPCFNDEYLPTFNRPNVHLVDAVDGGIERITANGVVVNGVEYKLDCLIFATGFEVGTAYTRRAGYEIHGRDGVVLSEKWRDGWVTQFGITAQGFPNCFFIGFTQTPLPQNIPHLLAEMAEHSVHIIDETRRRGAATVETTHDGERAWQDEMRRQVRSIEQFYLDCTPGYYNSEGHVENPTGFFLGIYGGGAVRYFEMLREWRDSGDLAGMTLDGE